MGKTEYSNDGESKSWYYDLLPNKHQGVKDTEACSCVGLNQWVTNPEHSS
jgi:hypothetical protein